MRHLTTLILFMALTPSFVIAIEEKLFMNCALEAEVAMQVIDSKLEDEPLMELITGWQDSLADVLGKDYIEEMVSYAYMNYPVMTKLEIANTQLNKCLKAEGLLVERVWLPDT